jgi:predicted naringenin-chalcone synthase
MSLAILGIGTAVPPHRHTQQQAADLAKALCRLTPDEGEVLDALYRKTHIAFRHTVHAPDVCADVLAGRDAKTGFACRGPDGLGPDTAERMAAYAREALPIAMNASRQALAESGVPPGAVTHLVTVSCTGFAAPGLDIGLIKGLKLGPTVERTHVGFMGCHGALNGLRVACALGDADPRARILLCAVELCSVHYHYAWNPKRMVGNALFSDGAAALVGAAAPFTPDPSPSKGQGSISGPWCVCASGSCLFPDSEYAMTWAVGNHGFDMTLSTRVPTLISSHLRPWLEQWLAAHGLTIAQIGSWAIHPGGPRVVSCVEECLGVPPGTAWASREVLSEFGNMSSPTVLFILDRLRRADSLRPCVALGFGPGLVAEAALFR